MTEDVLVRVHVERAQHDGGILAAVVESATPDLGLDEAQAAHLARAAGAVGRAVHRRGFDDPARAALDLEVLRIGHKVIVRIDDLGLPFDYEDARELDGAVIRQALGGGWLDEIHHSWRGRAGNRTELIRHVDAGRDLRDGPPPDEHLVDPEPAGADLNISPRLGTAEDAEAICRLTWRTYGPTYQHDEYYQPERLSSMLEHGTQTSFVSTLDDGELVGHAAVLVERPGAPTAEAGRAMLDPRFRGHHLLAGQHKLMMRWLADHDIVAMTGASVTAHTRSQRNGPITSVLLAFLPPIEFEGMTGTETPLREAVLGGYTPVTDAPRQTVYLPRRDAAVVTQLHERNRLERDVASDDDATGPTAESSTIEVSVHADLGNAVLRVREIGPDLAEALAQRLATVADAGIGVAYIDLRLDDPAVSWAADTVVEAGAIFAGIQPLEADGVDLVRYQHLGDTVIDPGAIHIKAEPARELLDYVLAQHGGTS